MNEDRRSAIRNLARWAADEIERQRDRPERVSDLMDAVLWVERQIELRGSLEATIASMDHDFIRALGHIVKPHLNSRREYRQVTVYIGSSLGSDLPKHVHVPRLMTALLASSLREDPDEFYRAFEEVHPFEDGNGRVGSILWNLLAGNLSYPYDKMDVPPDFWQEWEEHEVINKEIATEGPD